MREEVAAYSEDEMRATGAAIAKAQHASGMIPWTPGQHGDPWNHVEAAMALDATGHHDAASAAYRWLAEGQRDDGSWPAYLASDESIEDARTDTNVTAYVATGVLHHHLSVGDAETEELFGMVDGALACVVAHIREDGMLPWSIDDGLPAGHALLAASSSVCTSLAAGLACVDLLDLRRPRWVGALDRIGRAVTCALTGLTGVGAGAGAGAEGGTSAASCADFAGIFAAKDEYAMDWYYPVLSGRLDGDTAKARLDQRWKEFVVDGEGVRCRSDGQWLTTAETAECALACAMAGMTEQAHDLLASTRNHRRESGEYLTGVVYPEGVEFPRGECTTYSAAAVVLAWSWLDGHEPTRAVFPALDPGLRA